jgi:hypothetical protein
MRNKWHLWERGIKHDDFSHSIFGTYRNNCRCYCHLPRNFALSFFSRIPIVSFYTNTLEAIGILKTLPDKEHNLLSGTFNTSSIKKGGIYFKNISKIIHLVYQIPAFDEIKLKRSEQHLIAWENKPIFHGGEYSIELLAKGELQATIYNIDDQFSAITKELDRMVRKRLAIVVLLFGGAAVLIGVLQCQT